MTIVLILLVLFVLFVGTSFLMSDDQKRYWVEALTVVLTIMLSEKIADPYNLSLLNTFFLSLGLLGLWYLIVFLVKRWKSNDASAS